MFFIIDILKEERRQRLKPRSLSYWRSYHHPVGITFMLLVTECLNCSLVNSFCDKDAKRFVAATREFFRKSKDKEMLQQIAFIWNWKAHQRKFIGIYIRAWTHHKHH
jgi:hypothetical protein